MLVLVVFLKSGRDRTEYLISVCVVSILSSRITTSALVPLLFI
jgi:hypothetical protein